MFDRWVVIQSSEVKTRQTYKIQQDRQSCQGEGEDLDDR